MRSGFDRNRLAALLVLVAAVVAAAPGALAGIEDLELRDEQVPFLGVILGDGVRDGVHIDRVGRDTAADDAGLRSRDVVMAIDGEPVRHVHQLREQIRAHRPGDRVTVEVMREGEIVDVTVDLGSRRERTLELDRSYYFHGPDMRGNIKGTLSLDEDDDPERYFLCEGPECRNSRDRVWYRLDCLGRGCPLYTVDFWGRPMLGVQLADTTPDLREHLGASRDEGVLVSKVIEGSPAEQDGIQVGDLIVRVEDRTIARSGDIGSALRRIHDVIVEVEVIRDGRPLRLDVEVQATVER
jgi:S1-C subfamily serine protease